MYGGLSHLTCTVEDSLVGSAHPTYIKTYMKTIHHITRRQVWEEAQIIGSYRADSLLTEGFIHCSTATQVLKTADRFFKNQTGLIILYINVNKVESEVKYELAVNELFPHIYGALNIDAVYQIIDFETRNKYFVE